MYLDTEEKFYAAMQGYVIPEGRIAVAFSGGGDSTALLLLMRACMLERGKDLIALTVDHGLRPESAAEANKCAAVAASLGIHHRILRWVGEKPVSRLQERARTARYDLLREACNSEGIRTLALAHNLEDRLETFWMRLAGGSGLDGLAGLQRTVKRGELTLLRPLLDVSREELRAFCRRCAVEWIEDPSNSNERFLRPRLRAFEQMLAEEGLTPVRLSQTLEKLMQASDALRVITDKTFDTAVVCHPAGYMVLHPARLAEFPVDIRHRVISKVLHFFSPQEYPPPYEGVENLRHAIEAGNFVGSTFYDCEIFSADNAVFFVREAAAAEEPAIVRDGLRWDRHFVLSGRLTESTQIAMLGEEGLRHLRKDPIPSFEALPYKVQKVLPALWQGEKPVAVPCLSWFAAAASPDLRALHIRAFAG